MTSLERFWSKVEKTDGCWLWKGATAGPGYGRFRLDGVLRYAHRFSYEISVGPIPKGLEMDHLCRTKNCVNPSHLQAVTHQINILRGFRRA